jgi:8-oxo-dGTP pyrophosphatase MutT (NUDIX family)
MKSAKELCIPVISAIIERKQNGKKQVLMMTRWKPKHDPVYSGTLEIPAGRIPAYMNVYDAVRQEVFEETGLTITKIIPETKTKIYSPNKDGAFAFVPFCCQQQLKNGEPWIGFVFLCQAKGEPKENPDETKDVRWMDYDELKKIFEKTPEKIFTLQLGVLDYYFKNSKSD